MEFDKVSITTPNVIHPFADYAFLNVAIPDMHIYAFNKSSELGGVISEKFKFVCIKNARIGVH